MARGLCTCADVMSAVRTFAETTSIRGVGRALKSRGVVMRVVWAVAVFTGLSLACLQLTTLLQSFLAYDTLSSTREVTARPTFPDITVCNLSPLAISNVNGLDIGTYSDSVVAIMESPGFRARFVANTNYTEDDVDRAMANVASLSGYFQNVNLNNISEDGLQDFVIACQWNNWEWKEVKSGDCVMNLTRVFSPDYFLCYTLRVPEHLGDDVRGVAMMFFLNDIGNHDFTYFSPSLLHTKASGVRLVIHPPGTIPDAKDGVTVPPGHETSVLIAESRRYRLKDPYGACQDRDYINSSRPRHQSYRYTESTCLSLCYQQQVTKACRCVASQMLFTDDQLKTNQFCGKFQKLILEEEEEESRSKGPGPNSRSGLLELEIAESDVADIVNRVLCAAETEFEKSRCDCPEQCNSTHYSKTISQAPWPHHTYQQALYDKYIKGREIRQDLDLDDLLGPEKPDKKQSESDFGGWKDTDIIKDNFLQVNVYFEKQLYTELTDKPSSNLATLFATIGGALNLWIGITFMTCVELLELLYHLVLLAKSGPEPTGGATKVLPATETVTTTLTPVGPPGESPVKSPFSEPTDFGRSVFLRPLDGKKS